MKTHNTIKIADAYYTGIIEVHISDAELCWGQAAEGRRRLGPSMMRQKFVTSRDPPKTVIRFVFVRRRNPNSFA